MFVPAAVLALSTATSATNPVIRKAIDRTQMIDNQLTELERMATKGQKNSFRDKNGNKSYQRIE
jgi:hypothetical protein